MSTPLNDSILPPDPVMDGPESFPLQPSTDWEEKLVSAREALAGDLMSPAELKEFAELRAYKAARETTEQLLSEGEALLEEGHPEPDLETDVVEEDGEPAWKHEILEDFHGMTLEVRKPSQRALAAVNMGVSKHMSLTTQNDMISRFIRLHMSEKSFDELFDAIMDPDFDMDETESGIFGELFNRLIKM